MSKDAGEDWHPATQAAHAGGQLDDLTAGVTPAVHFATTFSRDEGYALQAPGSYLRGHNPNAEMVESLLARLEKGAEAMLFPSGMAAVAAIFRTLKAGDRVLVQRQIYYGTTTWIRRFCARRGVALHEIATWEQETFAAACAEVKPQLAWIETPSNPWLRICDIRACADAIHAVGGKLMVDSTAASPALSQPLTHGADIVMHSATKGINGHSDVLAGALCIADPGDPVWEEIRTERDMAGASLAPMEAWLLLRGMRTLPLRMERMAANALALAHYLSDHPKVARVFYPGLPDHPGHEIAARQMSGGFGGLLSFEVTGGVEAALAVAGRMKLFLRATSLGGVESLVEHRATIEPDTGLPEGLLRLSVGIEAVEDLMGDLGQALGQ